MPAKREKEVGSAVGNVVVTQAVVEKQPDAADEADATTGDSVDYYFPYIKDINARSFKTKWTIPGSSS